MAGEMNNMPDTGVEIAGVKLKNPVTTASGTSGYGREYLPYYKPGDLGAFTTKGLSVTARNGNPTPRVAETRGGMLNAIGLQNPGIKYFLENGLPFLRKYDTKIIVNFFGSGEDEYIAAAEELDAADVDMLEMNISCPNVKAGGIQFGSTAGSTETIVSAVRKRIKKPLIVKLSPNVADITETARAAAGAGADALSLINTLVGMRIDIKTRRPVIRNNTGGLSGPAVKPVALRMVWQVRNAVTLPIIGMGGIETAEDAVEFLLAGASAVAVGTASFKNPAAVLEVRDGILKYMSQNNIPELSGLTGGLIPW